MDIFELPLELIEKIFFNLDTQALATCALADVRFSEIIYSSHFLDEYCRIGFDCNVITAADVCNANVSIPFEFWHWLYTAMKLDDNHQHHIVFHSKYLTKIATLKHMYIMWLVCGMRASYMTSQAFMNKLYSLPFTVKKACEILEHPGVLVNDVLAKVFLALPSIMDLTCCATLEFFSMQKGGHTSLYFDIVCNEGISPNLPIDFSPLFSVEMFTIPMFSRIGTLLILINEHCWVIWIGFLTISQDGLNLSIAQTCLSKYFYHSDKITEIRFHAQNAIQEVNSFVYSFRENRPCPLISYSCRELMDMTFCLARQNHSALSEKFDAVLHENCSKLVTKVISEYCDGSSKGKDKMLKILHITKICDNMQLNNYIMHLLKIENIKIRKLTFQHHVSTIVLKNIVLRISSLYRNEIHFCMENSFCHSFLCGCIGRPTGLVQFSDEHTEEQIVKCMSEKLKDNVYLPKMWPSHILSAACRLVPTLVEILESDLQMILCKGTKYVIPPQTQKKTNGILKNAGLVLTQRPPSKPRCPPLLRQVRLWSIESLS